ncbi:glycoside hydrolase family 28 protein [Tilletiaria anomala UBC 951]|uniref:galacturonan 1,4-alpha-galacturonidase n=1 Tax=Tilletiaria anomala (strain ATCC 24038 / CBS 436.72 / UBC 951) TaxID=1037660 RepID=A0A066VRK4_TILAU|nr:glycoside hydrolase family 28 protein [Tilletiaria anomala UBC 951]KDN41419.1 glycoside hydrolase family 28 protein [Tilletiaria anomala UBC 951]
MILFTTDTDYWQSNGFKLDFQNVVAFFKLGRSDMHIYISNKSVRPNGTRKAWYDLYASNSSKLRPMLLGIHGQEDSTLRDLTLRYLPQYYYFNVNASNVVFADMHIEGTSTSKNFAENHDGVDTYCSKDRTIQDWNVNNGDDCVSFKPNSTNFLLQNRYYNGSHGTSVGPLRQYKGETDIVSGIYVYSNRCPTRPTACVPRCCQAWRPR